MKKILIVTDSSSDIRGEEIEELEIKVAPLSVSFGDETFKEGVDITVEEFYERLKSSKIFPKTSQATPGDFVEIFEEAKKNGQEVICMPISSGLSGTIQGCKMAAKIAEYEEHIHVIDTLACLTGLRLLVLEVCRLRDEGKSVDEIVNEIEIIKHRVKYFSIVDTLEYFHKGGRLSRTALIIGSLVGVKPFIDLDSEGRIRKFGQAIGYTHALIKAKEFIKDHPVDTNYGLTFGETGGSNNIDKFIKKVLPLTGKDSYTLKTIGAASGAHIGPGGVCVCYIEKENK